MSVTDTAGMADAVRKTRCENEQHAWSIAPGQSPWVDLFTCSQCGATRDTHPQLTWRIRARY